MKSLRLLAVLAILLAGLGQAASQADSDPLFANLSTDDTLKADMAIALSKEMLAQGHPVTLYLNSQAVIFADRSDPRNAVQQAKLAEFINRGGTVLVCPVCVQVLHLNPRNLIPGAQFSTVDKLSQALFREHTKTLSW